MARSEAEHEAQTVGGTPPDGADDAALADLAGAGAGRWSARRIAMQLVGVALSLSLLGWAISLAVGESNQASWEAMGRASIGLVLGLIGLSLFSLVLNGLMFWVTLIPLYRLAPGVVIGVNAIATFLSVLPFKVGLATRVLMHHRRDGVRLKSIVAWIAAMGALALATLLPLAAAGLWRRDIDTLWWVTAIGGIVFCNAAGLALGRLAMRWRLLAHLSMGSWQIVRHPAPVLGHLGLRLVDIAALAARFSMAAAIANVPLSGDQAILLATTYFLLSVAAPAGTLGFREAGVAIVALSQGLDKNALALVALTVSVAEIIAAAALALPAAIALRPDRLLLRRGIQAGS